MLLAEEHDINLDPADIAIENRGTATTVSAGLGREPRAHPDPHTREQLFAFEVSVHPVRPLTADDIK